MVTIKTKGRMCLGRMCLATTIAAIFTTTMFLAASAFADGLSWQYLDVRYQQPADDNTQGLAAELSGHIAKNWVLQTRVSYLQLEESALDLEMSQARFDLAVGRVFTLGDRFAAIVSAGYTRLEYRMDLGTFSDDAGEHAGNVQLGLRTGITKKFEAEASVGMLFDDEDTSDLLWNASLRYRAIPALSFLLGVSGVESDVFDSDDILYEIGFRFDLMED